VYDDASTDGSAPYIAENFPQVRLIEGERNVGFARANNIMAGAATGKYLLLLNNDAYLGAGALQALMEAANANPPAILSLRQLQAPGAELIDLGMGLDFMFVPFPLEKEDASRLVSVIGACMFLPRSVFFELGQFPELFESIGEDLFLCLAARFSGRRIIVLAEHCYFHYAGYSFGGSRRAEKPATTIRRRALSERNRFWIALAVLPSPLLVPAAMAWLAAWTLEAVVLCLIAVSPGPALEIYLPALRETVKKRREILELRRGLQAMRVVRWRDFFRPFRFWPAKLDFLLRRGIPTLR
jgi:GT2 family glycosyltransferase